MNEVNIKILDVIEHFKSNLDNSINGLYKIEINGNKYFIFRNGDSWGALSHYLREPVTKCIGIMRQDRIKPVEDAIEEYLGN